MNREEWKTKIDKEWQAQSASRRIVPDEYNPNGVAVGQLLQPGDDCLGPRHYYTPAPQGDEEE